MIYKHIYIILSLFSISVISVKSDEDYNDYDGYDYNDTDCTCMPLSMCKIWNETAHLIANDYSIVYCNKSSEIVCCADDKEVETISEKKCLEFTKIKDFCPKNWLVKDGTVTKPEEVPFVASIQLRKITSKEWKWICGGSLIDSRYVLTAAHCLDSYYNDYPNSVLSVVLGAHHKHDSAERFNIRTNVTHENADIVLLELDSEVNIFTKKIRPACLPIRNANEIVEFIVAGWGFYNDTNESAVLLKGTLVHKNVNSCEMISDIDPDSVVCVGPKNAYGDACRGDSGGPIFQGYPDRDDCLYELFAVVSEGVDCDHLFSTAMHIKVSYYRKWIEEIVWPNETLP